MDPIIWTGHRKPVARDNQIVIRMIMGLSLTYDHRVLTGATAARFFQTLEDIIENPTKIDLRISKAKLEKGNKSKRSIRG